MKPLPKIPNSLDIMKEASSKLEKIKHQRDIESKFLTKNEEYYEHISLFENKLSNSIFSQKLNIEQKNFSKIYSLLEKLSKLEPNSINKISKIYEEKNEKSIQTEKIDENNLINKISLLEKENEIIMKEKLIFKKENEILKKDIEELKKINNKLNNQYIQLNIKIDAEEKNKKTYEEEINKLKNKNKT